VSVASYIAAVASCACLRLTNNDSSNIKYNTKICAKAAAVSSSVEWAYIV